MYTKNFISSERYSHIFQTDPMASNYN